MVEYDKEVNLSELLKAVSDTTRRTLLTTLCQHGPQRVTELAEGFDMSLNAVSKHIKILEKAGLVSRKTIGRTHLIEADLTNTAEIEKWFNGLKSIWELRLEQLNDVLKNNEEEDD